MSLTNFTELKASALSWLNRPDLEPNIADFVTLAEAMMRDDLRLREQLTAIILTIPAASSTVALPADWIEFKALRPVGAASYEPDMEYRPAFTVRESGDDNLYGIEGNSLLVNTVQTVPLLINAQYYAVIPSLNSNATNWLLTKRPNIYLYSVVSKGFEFVMDEVRSKFWEDKYKQAVNDAVMADKRSTISGSPLTIRARR